MRFLSVIVVLLFFRSEGVDLLFHQNKDGTFLLFVEYHLTGCEAELKYELDILDSVSNPECGYFERVNIFAFDELPDLSKFYAQSEKSGGEVKIEKLTIDVNYRNRLFLPITKN